MQAMFELPDQIVRELETLAIKEGTTPERLIQQLVTERLERQSRRPGTKQEMQVPLIPITETGPIGMLSGSDLDDLFAREDLAS
jgi:hypothetical protein